MNALRPHASWGNRISWFECLSFALAAVLAVPPAAFAAPLGLLSSRGFVAHSVIIAAPSALSQRG